MISSLFKVPKRDVDKDISCRIRTQKSSKRSLFFMNTTIEAIDYPATLTDYGSSSAAGTAAMTVALNNVAIECPSTKVVLMGYSQGAHVVGDTMCGGGAIGRAIGVCLVLPAAAFR